MPMSHNPVLRLPRKQFSSRISRFKNLKAYGLESGSPGVGVYHETGKEKDLKKIDYAHEIQSLFRYHYKNDWVS